jgi:hypothetical protein
MRLWILLLLKESFTAALISIDCTGMTGIYIGVYGSRYGTAIRE